MTWTSGYVAEIDYTHGYYRELSPGHLRFACLSAGIVPPSGEQANYLELGFGQGLSVNIHAATSEGEFWGTDFNPAHAANAQALAHASGSGATLLDDSFQELAARRDLPQFDIIALHGIWSWISNENRRALIDIIRRKLRVGGIVHLSYNCLPGWAPALPLRHLITLHAATAGSAEAGLVARINDALGFARKVVDSGSAYFRVNSAAVERLNQISGQDRNYLAHEYFNRDWAVMPFSDVAHALEEAKLSFAASAQLLDHVDAVQMPGEWLSLLGEIHDPILRETTRDYLVNQQFRRDIFVKGVRKYDVFAHEAAWRNVSFLLVTPPDKVPMQNKGLLGEITLREDIYRPVLEAFADQGYTPKRLSAIADKLKDRIGLPELIQSVVLLVASGYMFPAQEPNGTIKQRCDRLNRHICERARNSLDIHFLASPVTGMGFPVDRFNQLFLLARAEGRQAPADLGRYAWDLMTALGQTVMRDGKTLESGEESLAVLTEAATTFTQQSLPMLQALGIA